jgi:hypothetical protein
MRKIHTMQRMNIEEERNYALGPSLKDAIYLLACE